MAYYMKAANQMVNTGKKPAFSAVILSGPMQALIKKSLGSENAAKRFTSVMISVVASSDALRACEPATVISCALRGEGMGLIFGTGYHVVPYKSKATFIMSYKGMIQLALATGLYADIDCVEVREGEKTGRNKRTGRAEIDLSVYDDDEERMKHPVIGYKAYFELKDGYYREEYWTVEEILRHAGRYSQAFDLELYEKWRNGEVLTGAEQRTVDSGSPWYDVGGAQVTMMKKTVLRSLLNSGYAPMSNEVATIIRSERVDGAVPSLEAPMDFMADAVDAVFTESAEPEAGETAQEAEKPAEKRGDRAERAAPRKGKAQAAEPETPPVTETETPRGMEDGGTAGDDFTAGFFPD